MTLPLCAAVNSSTNAMWVNRLKKYNPDKLTVVSFYNFIYMDDITGTKDFVPANLDYIISINGKDVNTIVPEDIYPMLNGRDGRVSLVLHSILHDVDYDLEYTPVNLNMRGFDETFENLDGVFVFSSSIIDNYKNSGIEIKTDDDIPDWSKFRKVSIVLSSSDPLLEKELAKEALNSLMNSGFPLIVDDENPDMILKVSFNEEESVTSTYVPQTTTYVDRGSNTYVTQGKYGTYINSFKRSPQKITDGGYTHENISSTHFLEVSLLDAKKMLDPNQSIPPVLWQLRYSKRLNYSESLSSASHKVLKYCRAFPGRNVFLQPCKAWSGVCWDENFPIVTDIYKDSPADKLGLQPGDEILKISGKSRIEVKYKMYLNGRLQRESHPISIKFKKQCLGKLLTGLTDVFPYAFQESPICNRIENNAFFDYCEISFPAFIHQANKNDTYEIKRNGKKMILTGNLYDKCYFLSVDVNFLNPKK